MNNNCFILGSGLIGCLAKRMFPSAEIIPFKKSRYYSFETPLADNFIICHKEIDPFMSEICPADKIPILMKSSFSYYGQLIATPPVELLQMYLQKVYQEYPDYYPKLLKSIHGVYQTTAMKLYDKLQDKLQLDINESIRNYGEMISIDTKAKTITMRNKKMEYEKIISTIPLDALVKFCGFDLDLKSFSVCLYNITSEKIDLEGNDYCYVADKYIDFFKVVRLGQHSYMFWCKDAIQDPYKFFGSFLTHNIDIVETFRISNMMPIGNPPSLQMFQDADIYCIGSNAQYDDMVDVSSAILGLLRLKV